MTNPVVSIVIPIYNTESYLRECLLSVQRQTINLFEAILVNDCTPDNAMEIAYEFAEKDKRFRIIEHKENLRQGGARNTGVDSAKGEYVIFIDSDDILPADALETMYDLATNHKADIVVGNMAWYEKPGLSPVGYIDQRFQEWSKWHITNIRCLPSSLSASGSVCHWLIKLEMLRKNELKFLEKVYWEDVPFSMSAWFFSKVVISTSKFVYFRIKREDPHNLSTTQTFNKKAFLDRDLIVDEVFNFSVANSSPKNDAADLGISTLKKILGSSQEMLQSAGPEIRTEMQILWLPQHVMRVENMIKKLSKR